MGSSQKLELFDFKQEVKNRNKYDYHYKEYCNSANSWKKYKEIQLDMSVDEFFDEFFSDQAAFGFDKMLTVMTKCWDLQLSPWKNNNTRQWKMMGPIKGIPMMTQMPLIKTFTIVHRSESKMVIESDNNTPEAPYGRCFSNKECWVIIGSQKDPTHQFLNLTLLEDTVFTSFTIIKSIIRANSVKST